MSYDAVLKDLEQQKFKPVYLLEGEEDFFIDQVSRYFEYELLPEAERAFNLTIFYGKDADWSAVVNACRRYPVFAERQVVMIKEAQAMTSLAALEAYLEKPLESTLLVVVYKHGKLDGRTRFAGLIKKKGVVLTTKKLYDNQLPGWVQSYVKSKGTGITDKAVLLLADHIGADLSRMARELDKLLINIRDKKKIDENDIEAYVGISKEYNTFEFQAAVAKKDLPKAVRIIAYFAANPKAGPIQLVVPVLYAFFSKLFVVVNQPSAPKEALTALGVSPYFQSEYLQGARIYGRTGVERAILLLNEYNLRSLGVEDAGYEGAELLKELVFKLFN